MLHRTNAGNWCNMIPRERKKENSSLTENGEINSDKDNQQK